MAASKELFPQPTFPTTATREPCNTHTTITEITEIGAFVHACVHACVLACLCACVGACVYLRYAEVYGMQNKTPTAGSRALISLRPRRV